MRHFTFGGVYTKSLKSGICYMHSTSLFRLNTFQVFNSHVWLVAPVLNSVVLDHSQTKKQRLLQHSTTFEGIFPTSSNFCAAYFIIQSNILKRSHDFLNSSFSYLILSKDLFIRFHCLCFLLHQFIVMTSYTKIIADL